MKRFTIWKLRFKDILKRISSTCWEYVDSLFSWMAELQKIDNEVALKDYFWQ